MNQMELAENQKAICTPFPPKINSNGIWENIKSPTTVFNYALPLLQLQILLIFFTTQACNLMLKPFGIPIIVSQILAGVILGPSLLGGNTKFKETFFTIESEDVLGTIATLGYTLFIFLCGVKMDLGMIYKTGRKACGIGFISVAMPLILGLLTEAILENSDFGKNLPNKLYVVTSVLCATPFPVIATLLADLNILNSELGRLSLSAGMIGEMGTVGLFTLATIITVVKVDSIGMAFRTLGCSIGYIMFAIFAIRPAMFWIVRQTPKGKEVKESHIILIIILIYLSGILSNSFGQQIFFGPFILGLAIPDGPPLGSALVEKLDGVVSGILVPLFVSTSAMRAKFGSLMLNKNLLIVEVILFFVTMVAKIMPCVVAAAVFCKMPWNDSFALALIMSCKGIVELATYNTLRDSKTIKESTFTVLLIGVLLTASVIPIIVRKLYDPSRKYAGYQKRNIFNLKSDSELRILMCIHSPDDLTGAINLLDAASPTHETPINLTVLHLIKLIGRASPIFISHNIQVKSATASYYSDNIIVSFNQFRQKKMGSVSVSTFTAVSPPKLMHEDICTLALDKLTSLIVLPFHRNWSGDGRVVSENASIQTLNYNILERAPCSVGILVNRGNLRRTKKSQHLQHVAIVFIGGNDDREALAFAKRMVRDGSNVTLTVFRLFSYEDRPCIITWDQILDSEALKELKVNNGGNEYVIYREEEVRNGPQTAYLMRDLASYYDLIIVGRRNGMECAQTSGLSEWSEFPELGVIGDLLVSSDLNGKASVLVIQQQQLS